jgi:predicted MFS family arabinose efflux permease
MNKDKAKFSFTSYQKFMIFIMAITQFSIVLDFMIMSPLGDMLMKSMSLTPGQFGLAVSAYAFSAGISGLLTAGFADKFDRKKLLLFFYIGFILGTIFCGFADTYFLLISARIITGLFGGVIGSIGMAIITDLFDVNQRGRVVGFAQMGFGASQVLGVPIGLLLANVWGWQAPFLMVAGLSTLIAILIMVKVRPITGHIAFQKDRSAVRHLLHTVSKPNYRMGFLATIFFSLGGFMMMPFGSAFAINNLHITQEQLPTLFMISGFSTLFIMPAIGKISDKIDKVKIFTFASIWMMIMVLIYTNMSATPLWIVISMNILLMMGIMSRMIPAAALTSSIPEMQDRGAFMSINASLQQIAGGVAAAFAGMVVVQKTKASPLENYNTLGYVVILIGVVSIFVLVKVKSIVQRQPDDETPDETLAEVVPGEYSHA